MEILSLMSSEDISQEDFLDIKELCKQYSRGLAKYGKTSWDLGPRVMKTVSRGVSQMELGNMLENFKTNIFSSLASQIDALQTRQKHVDLEKAMAIFFLKCRQKHPLKECPLNNVDLYGLCEHKHTTKDCLSLLGLKVVYKEKMDT